MGCVHESALLKNLNTVLEAILNIGLTCPDHELMDVAYVVLVACVHVKYRIQGWIIVDVQA